MAYTYEFIFAKDNKSDASFYVITVNVVRSKLSLTDSGLRKTRAHNLQVTHNVKFSEVVLVSCDVDSIQQYARNGRKAEIDS